VVGRIRREGNVQTSGGRNGGSLAPGNQGDVLMGWGRTKYVRVGREG